MSNITAIISLDGEIVSVTDFDSEKEFQFKVLNSLNPENIKDFFIKKTILDAVREAHKKSNGSNGMNTVQLLNLFKWSDLELYIKELEEKKLITKKQGVNLEMYMVYKK